MTKTKKHAPSSAIADVAHPGTSAPSDTSKPIITQRPMIKDPMVVDHDKPEAEAAAPVSPPKKISRTGIKPLAAKDEAEKVPDGSGSDETETETLPKPGTDAESVPEPEAETAEPELKSESGSEPDKEADKTEKSGVGHEASEPAVPGKSKPKADKGAATAAQAEDDAKLRKLIDSKKYFLPINAVEHRRSARFTALGIILALVLAVVWVDIALDAGLIHLNGIKPVTHLFSN